MITQNIASTKVCIKSPCTSISASSALLTVHGLLVQTLAERDVLFHRFLPSWTWDQSKSQLLEQLWPIRSLEAQLLEQL